MKLKAFEYNEGFVDWLRTSRNLPTRLFNRDGQVLLHPMEGLSPARIEKLVQLIMAGVYFDAQDEEVLKTCHYEVERPRIFHLDDENPETEGLSNTKLISKRTADELSRDAVGLLEELQENGLLESRTSSLKQRMYTIYSDFENQPDAMDGLVNIIELLSQKTLLPSPETAVKRTVVAMALKTRGMKAHTNKDRALMDKMVNEIMLSAMLCDVGYLRMKLPESGQLNSQEMAYLRSHPLLSYMLIAQDETLDEQVKYNVLNHHRPLFEHNRISNSYPEVLWLREKLSLMKKNLTDHRYAKAIGRDIDNQLASLVKSSYYNEDLAILAIASEFASLTTTMPWRPAMNPEKAIRTILNQSFFNLPDRIVRDFLDHVAVSLNNNKRILKQGEFVVMSSFSAEGKNVLEIGEILSSSRWQSRPVVNSFATVTAQINSEPRFAFGTFDFRSIQPHYRPIRVELENDIQRRIVYSVDPHAEGQTHEIFHKVSQHGPRRRVYS